MNQQNLLYNQMTLEQSQVRHTGFENKLIIIYIITTIKYKQIFVARGCTINVNKDNSRKNPFHILSIQVETKKGKPENMKIQIYTAYRRFIIIFFSFRLKHVELGF